MNWCSYKCRIEMLPVLRWRLAWLTVTSQSGRMRGGRKVGKQPGWELESLEDGSGRKRERRC